MPGSAGQLSAEQRIRLLFEGTAAATGEAFFESVAGVLTRILGTRYALVGLLRPPRELEVLAFCDGRETRRGARLALPGTPFEKLLTQRICTHRAGVARRYPRDEFLSEHGVESFVGVQLRSADGRSLAVLSAFHDGALPPGADDPGLLRAAAARVTVELDRLQIEAALEESVALTRGILDSSRDAILAVKPDLEVAFLNNAARRLFRLEDDTPEPLNARDLLPELQLRGGGRDAAAELEAHCPDGARIAVSVTVGSPGDDSRGLRAVVVRDVARRKREEQRLRGYARALERANRDLDRARSRAETAARAKTQFLANMSHEIRTPMNAILGFAEVLLENARDMPPDWYDAVRTIRRNGVYLLEILDDILDFSKIEADALEVERVRCKPLSLIADVETLMSARAAEKGIELVTQVDGRVPEEIVSDPVRLRQVLINLAGNAVKFTEQGAVTLCARYVADPPTLELEVRDTGVGIPAEKLATIFDPFSQADSSVTRRFGGTGLGLAISKRLVDILGGQLVVESEAGRGSTFRMSLPIADLAQTRWLDGFQDDSTESEARLREELAQWVLEGRVLVVEDGPDNQRLIRHLLERAGCSVEIAENGELGCALAREAWATGESFDVILMDIQMPVMDGFEATRRLRELGYTGPIIALTAHALPSERQRCLDAGCDDFATKPIERRKLLPQLRRYLSTRKRDGENWEPVS